MYFLSLAHTKLTPVLNPALIKFSSLFLSTHTYDVLLSCQRISKHPHRPFRGKATVLGGGSVVCPHHRGGCYCMERSPDYSPPPQLFRRGCAWTLGPREVRREAPAWQETADSLSSTTSKGQRGKKVSTICRGQTGPLLNPEVLRGGVSITCPDHDGPGWLNLIRSQKLSRGNPD